MFISNYKRNNRGGKKDIWTSNNPGRLIKCPCESLSFTIWTSKTSQEDPQSKRERG